MCRRLVVPLAALCFGVLISPRARATVMMRMSVEELAVASDAIVVGRVVRVEPREEPQGVVTHVTLAVDDWWVGGGAQPAPTVELRVHGGRVGDHATVVDGQATFAPGEDVVVFLFAGGGALWPQGMSQGKWRVVRDAQSGAAVAASQADAGSIVERDGRGALVPLRAALAHETLPLAALRARVRAARGD